MSYPIGRTHLHLSAVMVRAKKRIAAELYITSGRAKPFFAALKLQKGAIERELGYPLEWQELPARQECRISSYLDEATPDDKADWPRQHAWLAKRLNDMQRVFAPRVAALDPDPETPQPD